MAASRRSPNLSGKPNLRWIGLGPCVGEDPSNMKYSHGMQVGRVPGGERYFIVRAVTGEDWHAVLERGDEAARQIIEPIGTGTTLIGTASTTITGASSALTHGTRAAVRCSPI